MEVVVAWPALMRVRGSPVVCGVEGGLVMGTRAKSTWCADTVTAGCSK